jgi:hypothetical protein
MKPKMGGGWGFVNHTVLTNSKIVSFGPVCNINGDKIFLFSKVSFWIRYTMAELRALWLQFRHGRKSSTFTRFFTFKNVL